MLTISTPHACIPPSLRGFYHAYIHESNTSLEAAVEVAVVLLPEEDQKGECQELCVSLRWQDQWDMPWGTTVRLVR